MKSRTIIIDIETDSLTPTVIWCAVCIDCSTGEVHEFRRPDITPDPLIEFLETSGTWVGHNVINFDIPSLVRLVRGCKRPTLVIDTLVLSRLLDFNRVGGHSLESWGERLGCKKTPFNDFSQLTDEMVSYCRQDTQVNLLLYKKFLPYINSTRWAASIRLEHFIAEELHQVHCNGFHFDVDTARNLWYTINKEVIELDEQLKYCFPPKASFIREVTPRLTKFGTLNRGDFRWARDGDLSAFNGGPFSLIEYIEFNPGSPSQIVSRLNEAGWKPTEKTKGHSLFLREKDRDTPEAKTKAIKYAEYGWTVSETNLNTLPDTAPLAAKTLAKRIKYASRVRVLTEWIKSCHDDHRIHGHINHIGAWTQRCSHDKPNTGNIPRDDAVFGREFRSLWGVNDGYLVGVDAEGIQLRVLAHYINDEAFTRSVTEGKKEDGTDPHSLNKRALGSPCKSRNDAKTFIYAWLLGAGIGKVSAILGCSHAEAKNAVDDFITFYPGLAMVKNDIIPRDAARGYFEGFDGRYIKIRGDDTSSREHFCLGGYLQSGEAIIMKTAKEIWIPRLRKEGVPFKLVNFVHDEWCTQVPKCDSFVYREITFETKHLKSLVGTTYDLEIISQDDLLVKAVQRVPENALYIAEVQAEAIKLAGKSMGLRCPMAGSILSGHGPIAIGQNWYMTH